MVATQNFPGRGVKLEMYPLGQLVRRAAYEFPQSGQVFLAQTAVPVGHFEILGHAIGYHATIDLRHAFFQLAHLTQFHIGELGFHRAAPPQHINIGYGRGLYRVQSIARNVRWGQFAACLDQQASNIDSDIAVTDDADISRVEVWV